MKHNKHYCQTGLAARLIFTWFHRQIKIPQHFLSVRHCCKTQDLQITIFSSPAKFTDLRQFSTNFVFCHGVSSLKYYLTELKSELLNKRHPKQSAKFYLLGNKINRLSEPDKLGQNDHQNDSFLNNLYLKSIISVAK